MVGGNGLPLKLRGVWGEIAGFQFLLENTVHR